MTFNWQNSFGTIEHSVCGINFGKSLVTELQVFIGWRSQTSSGTSTAESTCLWTHSSFPSWKTQPLPHNFLGNFSHLIQIKILMEKLLWNSSKVPCLCGCFILSTIFSIFHIFCCARSLIDCVTSRISHSITNFDHRFVTRFDGVCHGFLGKCDETGLFISVHTLLFLLRSELCDVRCVTLFYVPVATFQKLSLSWLRKDAVYFE